MKKYRFYKNESGWFIDLKYFPFDKDYLAMVAGADKLLDVLAKGKNEVTLLIDTTPIPYSEGVLVKELKLGTAQGTIYNVEHVKIDHTLNTSEDSKDQLWLCPVTLWVFWKYPKKIYFKVDQTKVETEVKLQKRSWFDRIFKSEPVNLRLA